MNLVAKHNYNRPSVHKDKRELPNYMDEYHEEMEQAQKWWEEYAEWYGEHENEEEYWEAYQCSKD